MVVVVAALAEAAGEASPAAAVDAVSRAEAAGVASRVAADATSPVVGGVFRAAGAVSREADVALSDVGAASTETMTAAVGAVRSSGSALACLIMVMATLRIIRMLTAIMTRMRMAPIPATLQDIMMDGATGITTPAATGINC